MSATALALAASLALAADPRCGTAAPASEFASRLAAIAIHESGGDPLVMGMNRVRLPEWRRSELSFGRRSVFPHCWRVHKQPGNCSSNRPCQFGMACPLESPDRAFRPPSPKSIHPYFRARCEVLSDDSRVEDARLARNPGLSLARLTPPRRVRPEISQPQHEQSGIAELRLSLPRSSCSCAICQAFCISNRRMIGKRQLLHV